MYRSLGEAIAEQQAAEAAIEIPIPSDHRFVDACPTSPPSRMLPGVLSEHAVLQRALYRWRSPSGPNWRWELARYQPTEEPIDYVTLPYRWRTDNTAHYLTGDYYVRLVRSRSYARNNKAVAEARDSKTNQAIWNMVKGMYMWTITFVPAHPGFYGPAPVYREFQLSGVTSVRRPVLSPLEIICRVQRIMPDEWEAAYALIHAPGGAASYAAAAAASAPAGAISPASVDPLWPELMEAIAAAIPRRPPIGAFPPYRQQK